MTAPRSAGRPHIPRYGIPRDRVGLLAWERVERALVAAPRYWVATTDADGRPHLIQQWGAWVDGRYYLEGGPQTRWARNLRRTKRVVLSVERAGLAIMVEGRARELRSRSVPARLARRIVAGYAAKPYGYAPHPRNWTGGGLWEVRPERAFAWRYVAFVRSATRYLF